MYVLCVGRFYELIVEMPQLCVCVCIVVSYVPLTWWYICIYKMTFLFNFSSFLFLFFVFVFVQSINDWRWTYLWTFWSDDDVVGSILEFRICNHILHYCKAFFISQYLHAYVLMYTECEMNVRTAQIRY